MSAHFQELDRQVTPMGEISLRRRWDPGLEVELHEVRLDEEFLMSSLFTVAEEALARLGLAAVEGTDLDVVVGGLGLGCTAAAALEDERVASLTVIDALGAVIGWHRDGLLPLSVALTADLRCRLQQGDFFALVAGEGFGPGVGRPCDAVLLDVDHTPRNVLHPSHAPFYEVAGLRRLAALLRPGGVFALWSDDPPDDAFFTTLGEVFAAPEAHVVPFANPYTGGESTNTVYVTRRTVG